jgi:hypothetical protein
MPSDKFELPPLTPLELNRIVVLDEASRLSSLSKDSLREHYPHKIIDLSPRRQGMRVGDALMINAKKSAT